MNQQLENLNVYFPIKAEFPDPANIENTGQWYLLDHVSSSLSHFNHIEGKFRPMLAESESYSGGTHTFTLLENAKFHDGTPITADDAISSLKRLVILKSSTHFPLWEYIDGCDGIKSLNQDCAGLKKISDRKIEIRLKVQVEDFQLQMASPETGIWYKGDIDQNSKDLKINPTKYSGPYWIEKVDASGFLLKRNAYNPMSAKFPDSAKAIQIKALSADKVLSQLSSGGLDIVVRSRNPMDEVDYSAIGFDIFSSAPASLIYLHGAGRKERHSVSRQFVENLWKANTDRLISPADNFLPFDPSLSISKKEFLESLPQDGIGVIKVGIPWTYLSKNFYDFLIKTANESNLKIELVSLTPQEWISALTEGTEPDGVDFILAIYAASERYPAVQLRYISGKVRSPKLDLKGADTPELSDDKRKLLRDYQLALLKSQYAVPLFFSKHQMIYRRTLNIGDQPPSDAEVELWRVTRK